MKKTKIQPMALFFAICQLPFSGAWAYNQTLAYDELPQRSMDFIEQNFPDEYVMTVFKERDFIETRYNVYLSDDTNIEFFKNGDWKEINCKNSKVPNEFIPKEILERIEQMYSDAIIVSIDRDNHEYDIELSNGVDMTFDKKFNLTDFDD